MIVKAVIPALFFATNAVVRAGINCGSSETVLSVDVSFDINSYDNGTEMRPDTETTKQRVTSNLNTLLSLILKDNRTFEETEGNFSNNTFYLTGKTCVDEDKEISYWKTFFTTNNWFSSFFSNEMSENSDFDFYNMKVDWEDNTACTDPPIFKAITTYLNVGLLSLFGSACLFTIIGYVHSFIKWIDDIKIGQVIFFAFSMLDWYSDVLFTFSLVDCNIGVAPVLFWISFSLLAFPLIGNVYWLVKNQTIWETDMAVGPRLNGWLRRWRAYLFGFTILSGSSFGAVNLCNSNVFSYPLFRMGLTTRLLDRFDARRLWIVVVFENFPQLILQGYWVSIDSDKLDEITGMAMISSILSIIYAVATIISANSSQRSRDLASAGVYSFRVVSRDFKSGNKSYKTDVFKLAKMMAELLEIDHQLLEMHLPTKTHDGIVITFTVDDTEERGQDVFLKMQKLIDGGKLISRLQTTWRLSQMPNIVDFQWVNATDDDKSRATAIKMSLENAQAIKKTPRGHISDPGPGGPGATVSGPSGLEPGGNHSNSNSNSSSNILDNKNNNNKDDGNNNKNKKNDSNDSHVILSQSQSQKQLLMQSHQHVSGNPLDALASNMDNNNNNNNRSSNNNVINGNHIGNINSMSMSNRNLNIDDTNANVAAVQLYEMQLQQQKSGYGGSGNSGAQLNNGGTGGGNGATGGTGAGGGGNLSMDYDEVARYNNIAAMAAEDSSADDEDINQYGGGVPGGGEAPHGPGGPGGPGY